MTDTPTMDATDPVGFRIDPAAGIVYLTLRGDVTFADFSAAQRDIVVHPTYASTMSMYIDCRVVTSIPTREQVRTLATNDLHRDAPNGPSMPRRKLAIVAMTRLGFELASTLANFLADRAGDVSIFTTHDSARLWLGLK